MNMEEERLKMWKNREEMLKWAEENTSEEFKNKTFEIIDEIHSNWTDRMTFGTYPKDKKEFCARIFLKFEMEKRKEDLLKLKNKEFSTLCPELYREYEAEEMNNYIWYFFLRETSRNTGIEIVSVEDVLNLPVWSEEYLGWEKGELEAIKTRILCELAERNHKGQKDINRKEKNNGPNN